jgi:hypothetical protein
MACPAFHCPAAGSCRSAAGRRKSSVVTGMAKVMRGLLRRDGGSGAGNSEVDDGPSDLALGFLSLGVCQGQVDAVDLAGPLLCDGAFAAGEQVGFELVRAEHLGVDVQLLRRGVLPPHGLARNGGGAWPGA